MTKLVNYYFCCPKWPTFVFPKRPNNQLCIKFQYDTIYGLFLVCIPKWPINQLHINSQNDQVGKFCFCCPTLWFLSWIWSIWEHLWYTIDWLVILGVLDKFHWLGHLRDKLQHLVFNLKCGHFGSLTQILLTWPFWEHLWYISLLF